MNRLEKLEAKKKHLELALSKLNSDKQRKERTRRLIQKGALLEKYFEIDNLSVEETEEFLSLLSNFIIEKKPTKFRKNEKL